MGLIITLIIIALTGLTIFQVSFLNSSVRIKEQTFDENVSRAMGMVTEGMETRHAMQIVIELSGNTSGDDSLTFRAGVGAMICDSPGPGMFMIAKDTLHAKYIKSNDSLQCDLQAFTGIESLGVADSILTDTGKYRVNRIMYLKDFEDSLGDDSARLTLSPKGGQIDFLERVINRIWQSESLPIEQRLDSTLIDSLINVSLIESGITLDYLFGIKYGESDSLLISSSGYEKQLLNSKYSVRLFPYDMINPVAELRLFFPERRLFIWQQFIPVLATVTLLMGIIVFCFVYTIKIIFAQKKGAVLMTDFVNNMTHEFKTPISTISLAAEAIMRSDIISEKEKVKDFSKMILDENTRMRRQTDKILQMAALEEGSFRLKLDRINLHEIISEAAAHITLQVEGRGGKIISDLKAEETFIKGDKVHISGIIYNLLDNACKYSPNGPEITISTINAENGIYIRIVDNGIGIKDDDLKLIFNKYYRVSTGNIHDVKGFGLGLSYVKLMVEAHGGRIIMKSQYGHGTRVEIFFPVDKEENRS
ncbi:MAG: HAMP domain-containing sensor histidine kinase [Candidatus Zixiibacteriota bacterium]